MAGETHVDYQNAQSFPRPIHRINESIHKETAVSLRALWKMEYANGLRYRGVTRCKRFAYIADFGLQ